MSYRASNYDRDTHPLAGSTLVAYPLEQHAFDGTLADEACTRCRRSRCFHEDHPRKKRHHHAKEITPPLTPEPTEKAKLPETPGQGPETLRQGN